MGRDYRKLEIWQKSYELVLSLYPLLSSLPDSEQRNLVDQARRAATSIPLNVAEGCSARSNRVFLHHLNYAYASAKELEVVVMLCRDLGFLRGLDDRVVLFLSELDVVKKMLFGLMRSVESEIRRGKSNFSCVRSF